ncbi:MAG: conjugative transposon protein TraM [Dysgonamonadaceae bacterium]|jgi:conjugative transposon TraM protein|nr:conjugative transposon protein TraM [Dysgonamonadaceae bacterium]
MSTNKQTVENKPKFSNEQKQKMKKYAVFALMGIICAGCMWLIFAPSADEKAKHEQTAGFNSDIPMPKEEGLIGDKRDAYEQEQMKQKQAERMRSLEDFTAMTGGETSKPSNDLILLGDEPQTVKTSVGGASQSRSGSSIQNSARAYQDINRTLGNFYESPKTDPEKEKLQDELNELRERLAEQERRKNTVDEQMALMERSYQVASKYLPLSTANGATMQGTSAANPELTENKNDNVSEKMQVVPVGLVGTQTVSALHQNMSNADFMETYSKPRNMGFISAHTQNQTAVKNTIIACVHGDQTILTGQNVRFRLLEHIMVGKTIIPRNTLVSGTAKIQGERLDITVNTVEFAGQIIPVDLTVYDLDGQRGIFIPNLQELNAAKEVIANMGTSAGTSINLSSDAGEQFVADMGRNVIQGVSQFTAKKLREVKVHLKSGYKLYLVSEELLKQKNGQMLANK